MHFVQFGVTKGNKCSSEPGGHGQSLLAHSGIEAASGGNAGMPVDAWLSSSMMPQCFQKK